MSQESLAERSDYSTDFIGLVERGINAPSVEGCAKVAQALGIEVHLLFQFNSELPAPTPKASKPTKVKRPRGRPKLGS
jgi:transcriptional regulator with XRE-family HTH domain